MRVTYVGPHDEVEIPSLDVAVKRGGSIEVDNTVGHELIKQADWQTATPESRPSPPAGTGPKDES